jgi:hypothetical protein
VVTSAPPADARAASAYQPDALHVMTYNVGCTDHVHAPPLKFLETAPYKRILEGSPDAPILGTQETGPELVAKLKQLSAQTGNFKVLAAQPHGSKEAVALVIPKRYEVLSAENHTLLKSYVKSAWTAFSGWLHKQNDFKTFLGVLGHYRILQEARLRDTVTGQTLTVFNAHLSDDAIRKEVEMGQVAEHLKRTRGPTVITGDFNTATADSPRGNDPANQAVRAKVPEGFRDMGPTGKAGASLFRSGNNVDWVLAKGFEGTSSHMYDHQEITAQGYGDAREFTDHLAEEDTLRFAP